MAERSRKPFKLGLDPAAYIPSGLEVIMSTPKGFQDVRSEYSRLRREAEDRLRKLGQSEFRVDKTYTENVGKFKKLSDISSPEELRALTVEAMRFVTARGSSASGLRGIRRDAIATLHEHGYKWVNTRNFRQFADFMEDLKGQRDEFIFYKKAMSPEEQRMNAEDQRALFEMWLENGETFEGLVPDEDGNFD